MIPNRIFSLNLAVINNEQLQLLSDICPMLAVRKCDGIDIGRLYNYNRIGDAIKIAQTNGLTLLCGFLAESLIARANLVPGFNGVARDHPDNPWGMLVWKHWDQMLIEVRLAASVYDAGGILIRDGEFCDMAHMESFAFATILMRAIKNVLLVMPTSAERANLEVAYFKFQKHGPLSHIRTLVELASTELVKLKRQIGIVHPWPHGSSGPWESLADIWEAIYADPTDAMKTSLLWFVPAPGMKNADETNQPTAIRKRFADHGWSPKSVWLNYRAAESFAGGWTFAEWCDLDLDHRTFFAGGATDPAKDHPRIKAICRG